MLGADIAFLVAHGAALTCLTRSGYSEEMRLHITAQARIRRRRRRTLASGLVEKHEGKVQKQNPGTRKALEGRAVSEDAERRCAFCGEPFEGRRPDSQYCSNAHNRHRRPLPQQRLAGAAGSLGASAVDPVPKSCHPLADPALGAAWRVTASCTRRGSCGGD
jgi:hypothetical protein